MKHLLNAWFSSHQRPFPWREQRSPYRVWISEIMLQQTRASVVVPYFLRWIELFPDVKALYMASEEEVIKAWEGLGYYARARGAHRAAAQIVERFGGHFPNTSEALLSLPGFGPYTVGAVLSFAFQKKGLAIDGNVMRVISRLFCVEESLAFVKTKKIIEGFVDELIGEEAPWVSMEALIELGALVCTPRPQCSLCPLQGSCQARKKGKEALLPIKAPLPLVEKLVRSVFVILCQKEVLVLKRAPNQLMAGLYEFPFTEGRKGPPYKGGIKKIASFKEEKHSFTRYQAILFPSVWEATGAFEVPEGVWVPIEKIKELPFSAGHKKIANQLVAFEVGKSL